MKFEKRKAATLASLGSTEADKSPKGTLDTPIIPLLDAINQNPSYFTTSSCSGRISILSQPLVTPTAESSKPKKKSRGGSWVFITHDPADQESVLSLLFPPPKSSTSDASELVFRFEPLIIAVECKDLSSAQSLVSTAISCGFRESGITNANKRVIIAIRCSIRLEVPLGNTRKMMVSPEYVRYLVEVANEKMEANRNRTEGFMRAFLGNSYVSSIAENGNDKTSSNVSLRSENDGEESYACDDSEIENISPFKKIDSTTQSGSVGVSSRGLFVTQMKIAGEPVEKLFLWGHSACTLDNTKSSKILVFGGFGGMGRHARRNDSLLLDPYSCTVKAIIAEGCPSPRLGHTSSLVKDSMFVIGGRGDPVTVISDVWSLDIANSCWKLSECGGSVFHPRHRHAAAVVGSNIYVFGGVNNDVASSSLHVLDTINLQWKEIPVSGNWPCARHSHAMVAYGNQIFMFGGYNGEKALGDLHSFNVQTCQWKQEKTEGRKPHARFSHSMFVYKNYLGVLGGCPVRQHFQELALLDLQLCTWKHVVLESVDEYVFVRSTANIVGDDLVIVGGGASCYAFGTKFSEPVKINLFPLIYLDDHLLPFKDGRKHMTPSDNELSRKVVEDFIAADMEHEQKLMGSEGLHLDSTLTSTSDASQHWVVQIERKFAKQGKDILKKFGWLDLERKVYSQQDGIHIYFPVTQKFSSIFHNSQLHPGRDTSCKKNELPLSKSSTKEGLFSNGLCSSEALRFLQDFGASILADEVVEVRRAAVSPAKVLSEAVSSLIKQKGLPEKLLEELPSRWDRLGDIVVLSSTSFQDPLWDSIAKELWPIIAKSLHAPRLARQGRIAPNGTRDSTLQILVGDNGWVEHRENGITYSFDATKCMFSWGNLSEKIRMARLDCKNEVIVDLFAGIGYFVLPFLVRAKAKFVYACEWNPHAVEALKHNLQANSVDDHCIILEGDNRIMAPKRVADRVCLGLLPTSECSWVTAVRALRSEGGVLHVHGNVKDSEEFPWTEHVLKSISEIARSEGHLWEVSIEHLERVKWYAPRIRHLVADVRCRQV